MLEVVFSSVNIALTILVLVIIAYWLISIIAGLDYDLDFDVDIDVDADVSPTLETASSIEGSSLEDTANVEINKEDVINKRQQPLKWWQIVLIYFNFVGLPFMFTLSCFVFFWWIISLASTSFLHLYESQFGFILMLLSAIPALFVTKIFSAPFKSFFKKLNKDGDAPIDFIGRQGISLSTISEQKMGTAEVVIDGNPYTIYIKTENGETLNYQENFLIIRRSTDKNFYFVQPYQHNY